MATINRSFQSLIAGLFLALIAGGAAHANQAPGAESGLSAEVTTTDSGLAVEEALRQRVESRWRQLLKEGAAAAYAFEAPSYRALFDLDYFRKHAAAYPLALHARVKEVTFLNQDAAKVTVAVQSRVPVVGIDIASLESDIQERWLLREGEWWHMSLFNSPTSKETLDAASRQGEAEEAAEGVKEAEPAATTTEPGDSTAAPGQPRG